MIQKEKDYLMEMLFNIVDRAERDFEEYLYKINVHTDAYIFYKALISLTEYKTSSYIFKCVSSLLKCSQFDEVKPVMSKSVDLLINSHLTPEQDDLIFNYVLYILHKEV